MLQGILAPAIECGALTTLDPLHAPKACIPFLPSLDALGAASVLVSLVLVRVDEWDTPAVCTGHQQLELPENLHNTAHSGLL